MTDIRTILDHINFVEASAQKLEELREKYRAENLPQDWSKKWERTAVVERELQVALESFLAVTEMLISAYAIRKPTTHREAVRVLMETDVIDHALAVKLEELAGFRNIIVHGYIELDPEKIYRHWQEDPALLRDFIEAVKQYLKDNPPA